jgi:hypothetical protein
VDADHRAGRASHGASAGHGGSFHQHQRALGLAQADQGEQMTKEAIMCGNRAGHVRQVGRWLQRDRAQVAAQS